MAAKILSQAEKHIKPGVSVAEIDRRCSAYIKSAGSLSAILKYKTSSAMRAFPKSVCVSPNDLACHGVPTSYILSGGDLLNIDITVRSNGFCGDLSKMYTVGSCSGASDIIRTCYECLWLSISRIKPGVNINIIGLVIQKHAEKFGYSVAGDYCGHGIGKNFHEDPLVLHYYDCNSNVLLKEGMILTVEPILNCGSERTTNTNCWTTRTYDGKLSVQWEHTVLVTKRNYEVLTDS